MRSELSALEAEAIALKLCPDTYACGNRLLCGSRQNGLFRLHMGVDMVYLVLFRNYLARRNGTSQSNHKRQTNAENQTHFSQMPTITHSHWTRPDSYAEISTNSTHLSDTLTLAMK